jgi:hypothetical protein
MTTKAILVGLKFFLVGALFIISNGNLYLGKPEDFATFKNLYLGWLGNIFNYFSDLTGYIVSSKWLPG